MSDRKEMTMHDTDTINTIEADQLPCKTETIALTETSTDTIQNCLLHANLGKSASSLKLGAAESDTCSRTNKKTSLFNPFPE